MAPPALSAGVSAAWSCQELCAWLGASGFPSSVTATVAENDLEGADILEVEIEELGSVLGFPEPVSTRLQPLTAASPRCV